VIVRTERLRGEPVRPGQAKELLALVGDPRVGATLGGVLTLAESRARCEQMAEHWAQYGFGYWLWRDRDRALIGRGGLHHTRVGGREEVEVGWAVMADRWGEGFATEIGRASARHAFERLELLDVVAFTLHENHASRQVMAKLGFEYERDVLHAGLPHVLCRLTPGRLR
jgi:[ribosomal protein S5]-alanine N-acetyltransferase